MHFLKFVNFVICKFCSFYTMQSLRLHKQSIKLLVYLDHTPKKNRCKQGNQDIHICGQTAICKETPSSSNCYIVLLNDILP